MTTPAENTYDVGDAIELDFLWTVDGIATDPTTRAGKIRKPDGSIIDLDTNDLVRVSAGLFRYTLTADQPGRWWYGGLSTGVAQAAAERSFYVRRPKVL
jgi:hypothetical protein